MTNSSKYKLLSCVFNFQVLKRDFPQEGHVPAVNDLSQEGHVPAVNDLSQEGHVPAVNDLLSRQRFILIGIVNTDNHPAA